LRRHLDGNQFSGTINPSMEKAHQPQGAASTEFSLFFNAYKIMSPHFFLPCAEIHEQQQSNGPDTNRPKKQTLA
jgi:hypothetical protein